MKQMKKTVTILMLFAMLLSTCGLHRFWMMKSRPCGMNGARFAEREELVMRIPNMARGACLIIWIVPMGTLRCMMSTRSER